MGSAMADAMRIGVTGTDTGVGKTVVAAALVALLRARGLAAAGMKPVETGVEPGDAGSDAALLHAAAGGTDAERDVCPYAFPEPLAPWLAARRARAVVDPEVLDRAAARLANGRDALVIEGAGGLLVPLAPGLDYARLFARWGARLVVVAADRLGVLNHTLLTVEAARRAGIDVAGVVLSAAGHAPEDRSPATNRAALEELMPGVPVVSFGRVARARDPRALAEEAGRSGLHLLLPALFRAASPNPSRP
ncbi:MAG TPA: dethiobiotin synthase [Longimicrobiales bacterium]|nr:dethiobiotin synthase [Longimicrobiales bacterium]